jgi:hypothetical protein
MKHIKMGLQTDFVVLSFEPFLLWGIMQLNLPDIAEQMLKIMIEEYSRTFTLH